MIPREISIVRAQEEAELVRLQQLEQRIDPGNRVRNNYKVWSPAEDRRAVKMLKAGVKVPDIAQRLERNPASVYARLKKLGVKIRTLALAVAMLTGAAQANDDLILQDIRVISLNRPISVVVTDDLPQNCDHPSPYACASNAYGKGRCTIWIKPERLAWLYHDLQHCAGITHTAEGD